MVSTSVAFLLFAVLLTQHYAGTLDFVDGGKKSVILRLKGREMGTPFLISPEVADEVDEEVYELEEELEEELVNLKDLEEFGNILCVAFDGNILCVALFGNIL